MRVAGLDWGTQRAKRCIVVLERTSTALRVAEILDRPSDQALAAWLPSAGVEALAVDTPFGWPRVFADYVAQHTPSTTASPPTPSRFRFRETDLAAKRAMHALGTAREPLSVSSNLIALSARAWAEVVVTNGWAELVDLGLGAKARPKIIEVYPALSIVAFGLSAAGYKGKAMEGSAVRAARAKLVTGLLELFALDLPDDEVFIGGADEPVDALVAALTALVFEGGAAGWDIARPPPDLIEAVRREGWIFYPTRSSTRT
jgi:hypothetical protein